MKRTIRPSNLLIRRYEPEWGSHLPILSRVLQVSTGPIMELGIGIYSTPLIHFFALEQHRHVYSYESDQRWYDAHKYWTNDYHSFEYVTDWDTIPIEKYHWGIIFIESVLLFLIKFIIFNRKSQIK